MAVQLFHHFPLGRQSGYIYSREEKLKQFESDCRNHQTLYYNMEGPLNYITVNISSKNYSIKQIQDFIKNFTCFGYNSTSHLEKIEFLAHFIYKEYSKYEEVRLYILWVFCLEFEQDIIRAYPVFKIFKNTKCFDFFDWNGKTYKSWTNFLDNYSLPLGVICVPRNGKYEMENDFLCLEYYSTEPVYKKLLNIKSNFFKFQPHVNRIYIWLEEIYNYLIEMPEKIVIHFSNLWSLMKPLSKKALVVGVVLFKVSLSWMIKYKYQKKFDMSSFIELTSDLSMIIRSSNNFEEIKKVQDYFDNLKTLDILFKRVIIEKNTENWKELTQSILKAVEPLFAIGNVVLPFFIPQSELLFSGLKVLQSLSEPSKKILCKDEIIKEFNSNFNNDTFLFTQRQHENDESKVISENLMKEMHDDFLKPTIRKEEIRQNVQFEPKRIIINSLLPKGKKKPISVFYVFEDITFAEVTKELKKILGSDLKLIGGETSCFDVFNSNENHLGEVFYAKNKVVMGLFKYEAVIKKDSNTE